MSGRTVALRHSEKYRWWLAWGRETFYNGKREMLTWDTPDQAKDWLRENRPDLRLVKDGETEASASLNFAALKDDDEVSGGDDAQLSFGF